MTVTEEQFAQALTVSIVKYFGEVGLSRIAPKLIRFDSRKSSVVLAFAKDHVVEMQAALAFIRQVGESEALAATLENLWNYQRPRCIVTTFLIVGSN